MALFNENPMFGGSPFGDSMPSPAPQMGWQDQLFGGGLLANDIGLDDEIQKRARQQAMLQAGLQILAGSGRQPGSRVNLGRVLAEGLQAGQQGYEGALRSGMTKQRYEGQKASAQSQQAMRQELASLPSDQTPESLIKRAQVFEKYGDYDNAQKYYDAAQKFAPKPKELPSAVQEYEYARGQGYGGTFADFQRDMKRAGATQIDMSTGQKGFDNEMKLRGDFKGEPVYKAFQEVRSAHSQISQALKSGTPAGDLAGATKFMKLLDPGSVVRESELAMAMAASGALDRLYNYADRVVKGTKLTPDQRADFQRLADQFYSESANQYNAKANEYQRIAGEYDLNSQRVTGPLAPVVKTADKTTEADALRRALEKYR